MSLSPGFRPLTPDVTICAVSCPPFLPHGFLGDGVLCLHRAGVLRDPQTVGARQGFPDASLEQDVFFSSLMYLPGIFLSIPSVSQALFSQQVALKEFLVLIQICSRLKFYKNTGGIRVLVWGDLGDKKWVRKQKTCEEILLFHHHGSLMIWNH